MQRCSRRFRLDARGAVAPLFGLITTFALLPIGGAAMDLSRVFTSRMDLQEAVDATALALGKMPVNSTQAQLQAAADTWMASNLRNEFTDGWTVTVVPTYADSSTAISKIELTARAGVPSVFSGPIGGVNFARYPVAAKGTAAWGLQRVEVALVLDNTGSMNESDGSGATKSATLKSASKDLIDTLAQLAAASGDPNVFKVGMVPFATYVNVGASNQGSWITGTSPYDNDMFATPVDRFELFKRVGQTWAGCVESRPMPYDVQDTAPTPTVPGTMFVPHFAPDEPDDLFTNSSGQVFDVYSNSYLPDGVDPSSAWTVKQGNLAKYQGTPNRVHPWAFGGSGAIGPNKDCPAVPLIRLTTNYNAVKSAIDALVPAGNTHIPLGLMWGWHVVSPSAPFANGAAYNDPNVRKVVILVTDGNNTYSAGSANPSRSINNQLDSYDPATGATTWTTTDNSIYTAYGYVWQNRISQDDGSFADPARAMNDRLRKLCVNMKAAGVTLYTIPLLVTDLNTKAMLQTCASSDDKYLEASSGQQLRDHFKDIAGSISALRLAR